MKLAALYVLLLSLSPALAQTVPTAAPTVVLTSAPLLSVSGLVDLPKTFTLADLKALPSQEVKVSYTSGSGATFKNNTHTFKGALLYTLLSGAKPRFNAAVKNDPLRWFVRAGAADNYVTVFSWGELDPAFGNKGVLVAYEQDGKPLADGGVQLVAPGDTKGGRYIAKLTTLQVLRADY